MLSARNTLRADGAASVEILGRTDNSFNVRLVRLGSSRAAAAAAYALATNSSTAPAHSTFSDVLTNIRPGQMDVDLVEQHLVPAAIVFAGKVDPVPGHLPTMSRDMTRNPRGEFEPAQAGPATATIGRGINPPVREAPSPSCGGPMSPIPQGLAGACRAVGRSA
jgi:hypothetical protein